MSHALRSGVTLVLGGARSGKSRFAEDLVEESGLDAVYVATGQAFDDEMAARIAEHRARRGEAWRTVEAPLDLAGALAAQDGPGRVLLVDCLTLWVSNLMMEEADVAAAGEALAETLGTVQAPVVLVSSEVGLGIVPDNAMARAYRDHAGRLNQRIAALANQVFFIAAGLPMVLKPDNRTEQS
ncbi:MAG: bifunctional adenosylcobinamide kinase/adenosylcobinamide-phosphate guanylyltransferase [Pseudomonadota bacterium]|nr:bifunctional adenosylcobinamide kinase/adenosylcobinamide-phosphate guanylyltransferase [Pseudomonadota bacterium]